MKNNITTDLFIFSYSFNIVSGADFLDDDDVEDEDAMAINLPGDLSTNSNVQDELERCSIKWRQMSLEYLSKLKKAGLNVKPCFKKKEVYEKGSHRRVIRYFCDFYDVDLKDDIGSLVLYISPRATTTEYIRERICGFFN